ncbi:MAG: heavy-metal-associated domain-containing protein [Microgenomates group bacterium]
MSTTKKIALTINGMHCASCAMSIDFDLEDLDGVLATKTNYAQAQTEIEFDTNKVTPAQICEQIKKTGYNAVIANGPLIK